MFWLSVILFFLTLASLVLDRRQSRLLLLSGLVGLVYSGLFAAVPTLPFQFSDHSLITEHWAVVILLQTTVAPVLTAWYAQGLDPAKPPPLWRTLAFTCLPVSLTSMAASAERLTFTDWPGPVISSFHYLFMFLATWKTLNFVYACGSPDRKGDRSVRVR